VDCGALEKRPRGHGWHESTEARDALWNVPAAQGAHVTERVRPRVDDPAGHASQRVLPCSGCTVSAGHSLQLSAPVAFWAKPGGHATHCTKAAASAKEPAAQGAHAVCALMLLKLPGAHASHRPDEALKNVDAGHATHATAPVRPLVLNPTVHG
jgi:hypothetical protein